MPQQLTFDLPARTSRERGDFYVTDSNAVAMAAIEQWAQWPSHKMVIVGPAGAGKSHLARVWCDLSGAALIESQLLSTVLPTDYTGQHVLIEDADRIAGDDEAEEALFHLHNLVLAEGGSLLLTSRAAPSRWGLALPDLASRMEATPTAVLDVPDETLIAAIIVKLFDDRQIAAPPSVVNYLAPRLPRSLRDVADMVAALDAMSLTEGRAVNRRMAQALLDKMDANSA
ncbi:MAG: chromosomal replication initiator DnaA [Maritimibacter sp.]